MLENLLLKVIVKSGISLNRIYSSCQKENTKLIFNWSDLILVFSMTKDNQETLWLLTKFNNSKKNDYSLKLKV